jgi:hypothetical protein
MTPLTPYDLRYPFRVRVAAQLHSAVTEQMDDTRFQLFQHERVLRAAKKKHYGAKALRHDVKRYRKTLRQLTALKGVVTRA